MAIVVHERLEAIDKREWNALVQGAVTSTVFQTWEWHRAFWDTYGYSDGICLVCSYDKDRLSAIAPFRRECRNGRIIFRFLGDERADYADMIYPPSAVGSVVDILRYVRKESLAETLELNNIPAESPTIRCLNGRQSSGGWYPVWGRPVPCPALVLEGQDEFVRALLAKKSLRRSEKYYMERGDLELRTWSEVPAILSELSRFFTQHIQRWSGREVQSLFLQRQNRDFYRRLTELIVPADRLHFAALYAAGRPIAYHFGFKDGDRLIWYKPTFDLAESEHYPGGVFLKKVVEAGWHNGLAELDFTRGDEFYKTRFANRVRYNRNVTLVPSRFRAAGAAVRESVRRNPVLLESVRQGIDLVREMRRKPRIRRAEDGGLRPVVGSVNDDYGRDDLRMVARRWGWESGLAAPEAALLERLRADLPRMKVLNVGPGIGQGALFFAALAQTYTGMDVSPEVVDAARKIVGDYIPSEHFLQADVRCLPGAETSGFDLILLSDFALNNAQKEERQKIWLAIRRLGCRDALLFFPAYNSRSLTWRGIQPASVLFQRWGRLQRIGRLNSGRTGMRDASETLLVDPDHQEVTPVLFIKPEDQVKELQSAGYSQISIYSMNTGLETPPEKWSSLIDERLYYLCRV